jgi:GntR family transcriptional regulator
MMPESLYRTIAADLRQRIESGDLHAGAQLPNEQELVDHYRASRNTIRQAIRWLTSRRLVESRPGQGTFVVKIDPVVTTLSADWKDDKGLSGGEGKAAFEEAEARNLEMHADPLLTVEPRFAEGIVASLLQIPEGTGVILRQKKLYLRNKPWSLETSYYQMKYIDQGASLLRSKTDIEQGVVAYLKEQLGVKQVGVRSHIVVRAPDDDEARFFQLPDDGTISVIVVFRIGFADAPGRPTPFRLTINVYAADINQFVINSGEVGEVFANPIAFMASSAESDDSLIRQ